MMEKATRQESKFHNTTMILKLIYSTPGLSRAEIARLTKLTRATVSELVGEMLENGLVEESGVGESIGGKPPTLLEFRPQSRYVLCLDMSSILFRAALIDLNGKIIDQDYFSLEQPSRPAPLDAIFALINRLGARANRPLLGIGVGSPGIVDMENGVIYGAVHLKLESMALKQVLEERYHLPVYIANDSQLAALAEYSFGEKKIKDNAVVIKIGEGIGSGIVLDGQIYHGETFGAGEIGHIALIPDGELCSCGNRGCLDTLVTEKALVSKFQAQHPEHPGASLDDLAAALQAGDAFTCSLVQEAGSRLGSAIGFMTGILNIKSILISGKVVALGEPFLKAIVTALPKSVLPSLARHVQVQYSDLGDDNVILGAAALVLSKELDLP
jgi:predicted NBD/HSP70 family sugar kinase